MSVRRGGQRRYRGTQNPPRPFHFPLHPASHFSLRTCDAQLALRQVLQMDVIERQSSRSHQLHVIPVSRLVWSFCISRIPSDLRVDPANAFGARSCLAARPALAAGSTRSSAAASGTLQRHVNPNPFYHRLEHVPWLPPLPKALIARIHPRFESE